MRCCASELEGVRRERLLARGDQLLERAATKALQDVDRRSGARTIEDASMTSDEREDEFTATADDDRFDPPERSGAPRVKCRSSNARLNSSTRI
jgi:hypothetical protein